MEAKGYYGVNPQVKVRPECLAPAKEWVQPTTSEIDSVLRMTGWSAEELARRLDVSGRTVRRWLSHGGIPYAAWGVMCEVAGFGIIWR